MNHDHTLTDAIVYAVTCLISFGCYVIILIAPLAGWIMTP